MSDHTAPVHSKWIIRLLVAALVIVSFIAGYYNVRFELLEQQQRTGYQLDQ